MLGTLCSKHYVLRAVGYFSDSYSGDKVNYLPTTFSSWIAISYVQDDRPMPRCIQRKKQSSDWSYAWDAHIVYVSHVVYLAFSGGHGRIHALLYS